jgi:hypothetical protein
VGVVAAEDAGAVAETAAETVVEPDLCAAVGAEALAPMGAIDEMLLICIRSPFVVRSNLPWVVCRLVFEEL